MLGRRSEPLGGAWRLAHNGGATAGLGAALRAPGPTALRTGLDDMEQPRDCESGESGAALVATGAGTFPVRRRSRPEPSLPVRYRRRRTEENTWSEARFRVSRLVGRRAPRGLRTVLKTAEPTRTQTPPPGRLPAGGRGRHARPAGWTERAAARRRLGGLRLACCPSGRGYRRSADARVRHAVAVRPLGPSAETATAPSDSVGTAMQCRALRRARRYVNGELTDGSDR
jgi:hypothetical protein